MLIFVPFCSLSFLILSHKQQGSVSPNNVINQKCQISRFQQHWVIVRFLPKIHLIFADQEVFGQCAIVYCELPLIYYLVPFKWPILFALIASGLLIGIVATLVQTPLYQHKQPNPEPSKYLVRQIFNFLNKTKCCNGLYMFFDKLVYWSFQNQFDEMKTFYVKY